MSRLGYADDEDYPGQFALWAANQARSLGSRKGMASLRELEVALEAMPHKRLVANVLSEGEDVCALGALIAVRRPDLLVDSPDLEDYEQGERTLGAAAKVGVPELTARALIHLNDDDLERYSPEDRYVKVLEWVKRRLADPVSPRAAASEYGGYGNW